MDIKRARVFVVDDDQIMRTFVMNHLRRIGILDLFAYADGVEALRELAKQKPDLIICDIHMKPMGGLEFVRHLRNAPNTQLKNTRVIFLSSDSSPATVGEALPLGVQGYMVKPPALHILAARVEQALKD